MIINKIDLIYNQIVADSHPRIRNGLNLDEIGYVIVNELENNQFSCEAIKNEMNDQAFDSISWYSENYENLGFPFAIIQMSENLYNFSTLFVQNSNKIQNENMYKCCTSMNGKILKCQSMYVVKKSEFYIPPSKNKLKYSQFSSASALKISFYTIALGNFFNFIFRLF